MSRTDGAEAGKLKIGDHWNVISIIALSQNNPLKAVAEFVENSIDASARNVAIIRGKQKNEYYLRITDDGCGIQDFRYVATHIGDSIKRKLKVQGSGDIQGEFGIGLLSFWTIGETLTLTSAGKDGVARTMQLVKGNPSYAIRETGMLFAKPGTELLIHPLLPGIRSISAEKIQNFLASELRDRIARSGVHIAIIDHTTRRELVVEPRKFRGRLIHQLPEARCPFGEIYVELYLAESPQEAAVGLYKHGTRVIADISRLERFARSPWDSRCIEGIIDASFLQLTPGTRDGIVQDEVYDSFCVALEPVEEALGALLEEQKRALEEEASRQLLNRVTRAFREAFLYLPEEDYSWLAARVREPRRAPSAGTSSQSGAGEASANGEGSDYRESSSRTEEQNPATHASESSSDSQGDSENAALGEYIPEPNRQQSKTVQKSFFEFAGPLHKLMISPSSSVIGTSERRKLKAIARDRAGRLIDSGIDFAWHLSEGGGALDGINSPYAEYIAPEEPCVATIELCANQGDITLTATAIITVTVELIKRASGMGSAQRRGLPGYTYKKAPGELWRSRYDAENAIILINNAHADFIHASRQPMTKLRYIARLFAKELVLANFPEASREEILERLVELTLYTEENLK